jgi:hypothetical protein
MEEIIMTTLKVTVKGQAARRKRDIREVFGILLLENKSNISLTIEEIDKIPQNSWANEE